MPSAESGPGQQPAFDDALALDCIARSTDMEFGSQEADNFHNVLGPTLKGILGEVYGEFRIKENLGQFKRQPPATRLVWFLVGIWSAIYPDRRNGPIPAEDAAANLPIGYVEEIKQRRSHFFQLLEIGDDFHRIRRYESLRKTRRRYADHQIPELGVKPIRPANQKPTPQRSCSCH
jgi:hypothetical protein